MSLDDPWVKLNQAASRALAKDPDLPLRYRLAFTAYGRMKANGHAQFASGDLARELGVRPDVLSRAIAQAKDAGLLMYESHARCLISPAHVVTGGLGNEHDPCAIHDGKRTRGKRNFAVAAKE